jgi:PAS domain S-box-containing protein
MYISIGRKPLVFLRILLLLNRLLLRSVSALKAITGMKLSRSSSMTGPEALSRRYIRLIRWSKYLAILVLAIGILVLARWQWDIALFKRPLPRLTAMNPLTALSFILAGISFLLLSPIGRRGLFVVPFPKTGRLIGRILACLVLVTGLLKLAGVFLMARLPIDRILFAEKLMTEAPGSLSDQMTIHSAFCFALSGISLLLLNRVTRRRQMPSQYVALLIAAMGLFSIIGYLYRVQQSYGAFTQIPTSVHIALCFLLLSAAMLLAHPGSGIMKEFTAGKMGTLTARYLLPLIFLVPIILSYLRLLTYWKEVLGTQWGIALLVFAIILIFTGIVWYTTFLLNKREEQKRAAERSLRESEERFRHLVSSVKDYAIFMLNPAGEVISWNEGAERIKGYKKEEIIGRNISVFYTAEELQRGEPQNNLSRAREYGRFENEGERVRKDGSVFWANVIINAIYDTKGELMGFAKVTRDITERKKLELQRQQFNEELEEQVKKKTAELTDSYQEIRELASHLQDVREEERASIAREIHDELGQQLTGLKMDLSWIAKRKMVQDDIEAKQKAVIILNLLDTAIKTVRKIATDLRPSILDDLGLIAAIDWQSGEFGRRSGISTEFISTMPEFRYSSRIAIGLFRICQESLTNVARHAEASKICISLQEQDKDNILLKIEDNGKGFEVRQIGDKKTLGLLGMRERTLMMGGEFRIESDPGKGTTLFVTVPLTKPD